MPSHPERLNTSEAISCIRQCAEERARILGLDGFVVVPESFMAALDLLLDTSAPEVTKGEAAREAETFVKAKARPDVLWEVWTERS